MKDTRQRSAVTTGRITLIVLCLQRHKHVSPMITVFIDQITAYSQQTNQGLLSPPGRVETVHTMRGGVGGSAHGQEINPAGDLAGSPGTDDGRYALVPVY